MIIFDITRASTFQEVARWKADLDSKTRLPSGDLLPCLLRHYPELLGRVYVAPINALFFGVWRVVRLFLREETVAKFALLRGKNWRARLQDALGPGVALPEHMRPPAS